MRKFYALLLLVLVGIGISLFVYCVQNHFASDEDLHGIPVPTVAKLDFKTDHTKHFHWIRATGTELPYCYKQAIKRAGFLEKPIDGQMFQFEKDHISIVVVPCTDYIEIMVE